MKSCTRHDKFTIYDFRFAIMRRDKREIHPGKRFTISKSTAETQSKKQMKMDWIALIRDAYQAASAMGSRPITITPVFHSPASDNQIHDCEQRLGALFPNDLRELLLKTNGVGQRIATVRGDIDSGYFVFSIERMLEINAFQRSQIGGYTMPLDCLLFFAEDGIGDYFGFAVVEGKVPHSRIYLWNHEDDSRLSIAPSLSYFVENWLKGKIKV